MGTNYYLIKKSDGVVSGHIGKRSGIGNGKCKFSWDMDPIFFIIAYAKNEIEFVEDEYGAKYHPNEWIRFILSECEEHDYEHVGSDFT